MSTLLVFATKHGCTEKCAATLAEQLTGKVTLCNLKEEQVPDLAPYEKVIIGGSIHIGKIQKEVSEFCRQNLEVLKQKKVGLFICGMQVGEAEKELYDNFPQELLNIAVATEFFGGEFILKNMNPLDRLIVKKVARVGSDVSNIFADNISKLAGLMNKV